MVATIAGATALGCQESASTSVGSVIIITAITAVDIAASGATNKYAS
jgi:hypothetical protein